MAFFKASPKTFVLLDFMTVFLILMACVYTPFANAASCKKAGCGPPKVPGVELPLLMMLSAGGAAGVTYLRGFKKLEK
jgi:hypothetical protein